MALRQPTPDEVEDIRKQGLPIDGLMIDDPSLDNQSSDDGQMSKLGAVGATLKGHAGGIIGGGLGALGTTAALGALDVTAPYVGIPLTILAGLGGGYLGQKAQQAIVPSETEQSLEQQAQQAAEQHPLVSGATDIAASALASGGSFSPTTALRAGRGLLNSFGRSALSEADQLALSQVGREALSPSGLSSVTQRAGDVAALQNVGMQAGLNPAINSAISVATGQGMPSGRDLLTQAIGGALFAKPSALGEMAGMHSSLEEPTPEPTTKGLLSNIKQENMPEELSGPKSAPLSPWLGKNAEGQFEIDNVAVKKAFGQQNPRPSVEGLSETDLYKALTNWRRTRNMLVEGMRQALNDKFLQDQLAQSGTKETVAPQPTPRITNKELSPEAKQAGAAVPEETSLPTPSLDKSKVGPSGLTKEEEDEILSEKINSPFNWPKDVPSQAEGLKPTDKTRERQKLIEQRLANEASQKDKNQTDLQRYKELNDRRDQMLKDGTAFKADMSNFSDEYMKGWRELEDIKNRNGGMPPTENVKSSVTEQSLGYKPISLPQDFDTHLISGKATTGSVLQKIAGIKDHPYQELAQHLIDTADTKSLNVPWQVSGDRSHYNLNNDFVAMSPNDTGNARVYMEEAIHSLTSKKLPDEILRGQGAEYHNRLQTYLKRGDNEAVKDLVKAYLHTADKLGWTDLMFKDYVDEAGGISRGLSNKPDSLQQSIGFNSKLGYTPYAMGNLHEFLAHAFNNEKFQNILNEIKSDTEGKTIWQKIVDSVRRILGLDIKQGNMLDRVLRTSSEIVGQERPSSIEDLGKMLKDEVGSPFSKAEKSGPTNEKEEPKVGPVRTMGFVGRVFRAGLDSIRAINHPDSGKVADAFQRVFQERENILGRQLNPVVEATRRLTPKDEEQMQKVMRHELETKTSGRGLLQNERQTRAYDAAKESLKQNFEKRLANEEPVYRDGKPTMPRRDENYWPTTSNPKVTSIYRENVDQGKISELNKTFLDYQTQKMGLTEQEAHTNLDNYIRAIQGSSSSSNTSGSTYFNAARKAQGIPLPPEFTRPGFSRNLEAYFHAQATDNAYYQHVESDPKVLSALGETQDPWGRPVVPEQGHTPIIGNTAVKNVLNEIKGESSIGQQGQIQKKAESLATATILGPLTELHKVVSNWTKQLTYADNPYQASRAIVKGITNWAEGWTHAKENGKVVMTAKSAWDMFDSTLTAADRLAGLARGMRQIYTLNDLTEKLNMGALQAMNEALVPFKIKSASEGDSAAIRLMQHLDPSWNKGKEYSPTEISQLASNLSGVIHGTRDARTLPSWMLHDNEISAFFKLSSWGIAQTNSFMRDVYTPATEGNLVPLLNATLGAAVGGYAIKELREKLAGKKSQVPSIEEIASSSRGLKGNIPALAYNMMAASSYAGFGGMLSTIGRYPFDWAFRNTPQGATFPLDTVVSDLASTASNAAEAIANDPNLNWLTLAEHVGGHVLSTDFQLGRVALNHAIDEGTITGTVAEKKMLSDKLGQLRRFEMVEGLPYDSQTGADANPYMNLEQKKYKMEQDLPTAMKELPGLLQNIVQKYGDKPDIMLAKMKSLKENNYATFPSLEETPLSFMKYISYLQKMEGPAKASEELQDYMMHRVKNQVKSSVVP